MGCFYAMSPSLLSGRVQNHVTLFPCTRPFLSPTDRVSAFQPTQQSQGSLAQLGVFVVEVKQQSLAADLSGQL